EGVESVLLKFLGDGLEVNADIGKLADESAALFESLFERERDTSVVAYGRVSRGRDGVDGLGADEVVNVEHVGVFRVLRARRGPEAALHLRAFGFQFGEALAVEDLFELPVCELRVAGCRVTAPVSRPSLLFVRWGL